MVVYIYIYINNAIIHRIKVNFKQVNAGWV